jgi:hypothetical protein
VEVFFESSGEFAERFEPGAVGSAQPQALKKASAHRRALPNTLHRL